MAKEGNYIIEPIYQGGYSSLNPDYGGNFTGYRMSARDIGMSTDARTANVLKEISESISSGERTVELTQVSPEVFESIPRQHLKELNQLSKLTGVDITFHAPVIEPSGVSDRGIGESNRVAAERQMIQAVDRAHELSPKGNIPVTFHSSAGLPGEITELGKKAPEEILFINEDSQEIGKMKLKERTYPGEKELSIENEIIKANENEWIRNKRSMVYYLDYARHAISDMEAARIADKEKAEGKELYDEQKKIKSSFESGKTYIDESYNQLKNVFETVKKFGRPEDIKKLSYFVKEIEPKANRINETKDEYEKTLLMKDIVEKGIEMFNEIPTPKVIKSLNEFAKGRTAETFANVALHGYKEFKNNAPIISIENPPAGGAFSTGKELKEIVELSREKFIENAKKQGMGESEARNQAEKLIGATLDVGHMNMLRRYGYKDKDLIKEAKEVAPLTKHVHLSDNFGFEHTELPMGMGNVPIKEIMENLDKEGFKGKKIVEAINWWQHFSPQGKFNPPLKPTLEAFGSPVYAMDMGPYWNQAPGFRQDYSSGIGQIYPQINFETWGTGFSQLPAELGGQRPGAQGSRMSGTPME